MGEQGIVIKLDMGNGGMLGGEMVYDTGYGMVWEGSRVGTGHIVGAQFIVRNGVSKNPFVFDEITGELATTSLERWFPENHTGQPEWEGGGVFCGYGMRPLL